MLLKFTVILRYIILIVKQISIFAFQLSDLAVFSFFFHWY